MPEQPQKTKLKILKRGKRKTPSEIEAEYDSAETQYIRAWVRRKPEKARKIFSEMLGSAV